MLFYGYFFNMRKIIQKFFRTIVLIIFFSVINTNCLQAQNVSFDKNGKSDKENMEKLNVKIIPIEEMAGLPEIDSLNFKDIFNNSIKDKILSNLKTYKTEIHGVNLELISKWAKTQMKDYKLPNNFIESLSPEKYFEDEKISVLIIKSIQLPSHSPLVKRYLYIIPVFNKKTDSFDKIFITIQGFVEE